MTNSNNTKDTQLSWVLMSVPQPPKLWPLILKSMKFYYPIITSQCRTGSEPSECPDLF